MAMGGGLGKSLHVPARQGLIHIFSIMFSIRSEAASIRRKNNKADTAWNCSLAWFESEGILANIVSY